MEDPTMYPGGGGPETPRPAPPRDRVRDVRLVLMGVVAVLLIWFAFANLQDVTIHFWLSSSRAPLILVILISAVLGMLAGALLSRVVRRRKHHGESPGAMPGGTN